MGILNVTPDSFSDGGLNHETQSAIARGHQLIAEGADLIDVGGESTRPGALGVDVVEELRRVIPVIRELACAGLPVSVDTQKPEVMRAAVAAGAIMVNDVNGFEAPGPSKSFKRVNVESVSCISRVRPRACNSLRDIVM